MHLPEPFLAQSRHLFGNRLCVVLQENIACARTSQPHIHRQIGLRSAHLCIEIVLPVIRFLTSTYSPSVVVLSLEGITGYEPKLSSLEDMQHSVADQFFLSGTPSVPSAPTPFVAPQLGDISPMQESPEMIPCMEDDVRPSVLLPIADEETPNLTQDQLSTYTRAVSAIASGSSATTDPYPQHLPQESTILDDSIVRGLSEALEQQLVHAAPSAGGSLPFITPEKAQLRMEVQSMHQQLISTQVQANDALEMQRHQARLELDSQRQRVTTEAQASMAVVASEADRVNASNQIALHDAALRLQSESQEMSTLRTELAGRNVSDSLMLQSEVIQMQNRTEVRLNEARKRTDNALTEQRTTFSAESQAWQRNEQAEMGKLRNEHLVYLQSIEQYKQELALAQQ